MTICALYPNNSVTKRLWCAFAKTTHIFFSKNTCELDIVHTRTVNILTTNNDASNNWAQANNERHFTLFYNKYKDLATSGLPGFPGNI